MKLFIRSISSLVLFSALIIANPTLAQEASITTEESVNKLANPRPGDPSKQLRVIFLPGSNYQKFRIGMESPTKCDVNIQVVNSKGMVVYSNMLENVTKQVEEINFSFLKRGEYTVKVISEDNEYSKEMLIQ